MKENNEKEKRENLNKEQKQGKKEKVFTYILIIAISIVVLFMVSIAICIIVVNSFEPFDAKPIIYLYPTEKTAVNVKLGYPQNLTCTYPKYTKEGWNVMANQEGTLVDLKTNRELYSLYWEGINQYPYQQTKEGFIVKGEEVVNFLEEKLTILGLNPKEQEEFIIYWLPKLEKNTYNYIRFATQEEINQNMPMEVVPAPDTIIRILMIWKEIKGPVEVIEQKLTTPVRNGFTVVEWGGTEIR